MAASDRHTEPGPSDSPVKAEMPERIPPLPAADASGAHQGQIAPQGGYTPPDKPSWLPARRSEPIRKNTFLRWIVALLALLAMAGVGYYWWLQHRPTLPPGFASGNGRLEADEINIDTKFAGRVLRLYAEQGDLVKAGQVVAIMDTQDLQAQLKQAEAQALQMQRAVDEARQNLVQQKSLVLSTQAAALQTQRILDETNANLQQQLTQTKLAQQEYDRTKALVSKGIATIELLDQRQQALDAALAAKSAAVARVSAAEQALIAARHNADGAIASRDAATARVGQAEQSSEAATYNVEYYKVMIADNTLIAPRDGPIEYRLATVGEVLPAGGKVFTMLDASYVYMDIYLPTAEAGRLKFGSEARIVLDAYPGRVIPANVVYVSSEAQFTPKTVETKSERDKLMFRIRVRIDPDRLKGREVSVRSGLPGMAYVRTDPDAKWPPSLEPGPATP